MAGGEIRRVSTNNVAKMDLPARLTTTRAIANRVNLVVIRLAAALSVDQDNANIRKARQILVSEN